MKISAQANLGTYPWSNAKGDPERLQYSLDDYPRSPRHHVALCPALKKGLAG